MSWPFCKTAAHCTWRALVTALQKSQGIILKQSYYCNHIPSFPSFSVSSSGVFNASVAQLAELLGLFICLLGIDLCQCADQSTAKSGGSSAVEALEVIRLEGATSGAWLRPKLVSTK